MPVDALPTPCVAVAESVAALADGSSGRPRIPVEHRSHVESCLRCQADLVQYRKLLRALRSLRTEVLEPAPGLLSDVLAGLEEVGERRAVLGAIQGRKVVYLSGIAAATAAGAAGALVYATRSRRLRPTG